MVIGGTTATLTATVSEGLGPVICSGLGECESWTTRGGTATITGDAAIWKEESVLKTDNVRDWSYCSRNCAVLTSLSGQTGHVDTTGNRPLTSRRAQRRAEMIKRSRVFRDFLHKLITQKYILNRCLKIPFEDSLYVFLPLLRLPASIADIVNTYGVNIRSTEGCPSTVSYPPPKFVP
jgi:hypothetical protein